MAGLTDAALSNWAQSLHTFFPTVGGFTVIATASGGSGIVTPPNSPAVLVRFALPLPPGPPVVGGIVELLADGDSPAEGSASSSSDYTLPIAAAAAGAVLALAVGGWYARRRWLL